MKKMLLTLCLMIMSASSFAIVNFSTSTGALVMRDVVVDDTTVYDSVTLQLNLADGTFTILDATLRDDSFSKTVLDTLSQDGIKIDFYGCALSGKNQITCMTKVTSLDIDQEFGVMGLTGSPLFDDRSTTYTPTTLTALNQTGSQFIIFNLIQGIPVEVKFIYSNISSAATAISAFKPSFIANNGRSTISANFRDIDF